VQIWKTVTKIVVGVKYKVNNTKHDAKGVGMIRAEIGLKIDKL
jgi:hypothetical protein